MVKDESDDGLKKSLIGRWFNDPQIFEEAAENSENNNKNSFKQKNKKGVDPHNFQIQKAKPD